MKNPDKLIRPILCIGLRQITQAAVIPLMCVDFFGFGQRRKRIFINWTYGSLAGAEIKFDSDLGKMKLLQLESLKLDGKVQLRFMLPSERGRTFSERMKEIIDTAEDGSKVLFVIPKDVPDSEFYSALSILVNPSTKEVKVDEKIMGDPVLSLKELGVEVNEPFGEVNPFGL